MLEVVGLQWDTIGSLPFTANLHAYYYNGRYATRPVVYGRGKVWIDVLGNAPSAARWLDVEDEDAKPENVPGWLDARKAVAGTDAGVYCNRVTLPQVIAAADGRPMDLWLATLDGTIFPTEAYSLPSNVHLVAVQAFGSAYLGINADLSMVVDQQYWNAYAA
jgi:hypothetical protein